MTLTSYFISFSLFLATLPAISSADQTVNIGKRSSVLESRQGCRDPGLIPACPGFFKCIPPGGICCSDGITYVMPPRACPAGTEPLTTAGAQPVPSPLTSTAVTKTYYSYSWFTTEFTWHYWYYYYTYIAIYSSTAVTSSDVATVTTVSVSATDSAQASALFRSLSATLSFPTPKQTATSLVGARPTDVPTYASNTTWTTTTSPTSPATFSGAATALRAEVMASWNGASWALAALVLIPGLLMAWL